MAHSTITFVHPKFGTTKIAPVGYDWYVLLIGPISPFLRQDFKWALIVLVTTFVVGSIIPIIGAFVAWGIFGIVYNKIYIKSLLDGGYSISHIESEFTAEQLQAMLELDITGQ